MKKIAIIGTGYVGLVTGACLASLGHNVICIDNDKTKIENLKKGIAPFYEPDLDKLLDSPNLSFDLNFDEAEIVMCCVGTPCDSSGKVDMTFVNKVVEDHAKKAEFFVMKSTVPIGTCSKIDHTHVISNPEFLRQGSAITDTLKPDRIVVGVKDEESRKVMEELYEGFEAPVIITNLITAELSKYAANAYLSTKISFINEFANFTEKVGADFSALQKSLKHDTRIGPEFLEAGIGFGGSCLPKDLTAILSQAEADDFHVLRGADKANKIQKGRVVEKLKKHLPDLKGRKVGILGLSFKPNTDDMRDAPSLDVIDGLMAEGCEFSCYDPQAKSEHNTCKNAYEACENADALVVLTEWEEFKSLDLEKARNLMKGNLLIDGRNVLDSSQVALSGLKYEGLGGQA